MKIDEAIWDMHGKIEKMDARTVAIEDNLKEYHKTQSKAMTQVEKRVDKVESDNDKAKGAVKLVVLIALLAGLILTLSRLDVF